MTKRYSRGHPIFIPEKGLQVVAANDLKAGDQLLINYGHRSDDELLLNYGFVLGPGFNFIPTKMFKNTVQLLRKPFIGPELNTHTTLRITIPSAREVLYYGLGIKDEVFNEALEKSWVG